jgi:hypothetical protein
VSPAKPPSPLRAFLIFLALASACATAPPPKSGPGPLTRRAMFDLNCAASELMATKIDDKTIGVRGCGKRAVYVELCQPNIRRPYEDDECRWLRQGEVQEDGPPPQE